jgi:hypothetical protein
MATRNGAAGLTAGADDCDLAFGIMAKERTARIKTNARFIAVPPGISAVNPNIAGLAQASQHCWLSLELCLSADQEAI